MDLPDFEQLPNGKLKWTTRLTWEQIGRLILSYRVEGMTHDESTAWLESHVPNYREGMITMHITEGGNDALPNGSLVWIARPPMVTITGTIVDA